MLPGYIPGESMPLQNRVTPFGEIIASAERGTLMGNRGCLHDAERRLTGRRWTTRAWVTCALAFKDRRRQLMTPGNYTELFFLDEATALAAGHRPCAECRRADYLAFKRLWAEGVGVAAASLPVAELDRVLHADRVEGHGQRTYRDRLGALPDGALVALEGSAFLKWSGNLWAWSLGGYALAPSMSDDAEGTVLTPRSTVQVLRAGYRPSVHPSAAPRPAP